MDLINNLLVGFEAALSLQNILYCFFGVTIGTLIGVLPGMGPSLIQRTSSYSPLETCP